MPAHLVPSGSPWLKQLCHLQAQPSPGQSCRRQKSLGSMHLGSLECLTLWNPVNCGLSGFSVRGVLQARIVTRVGCHTLLEDYTSCSSSYQLPCAPGVARAPATQADAPPPHLALTWADPSPSGQSQEKTPVDDPHVEVQIKPQLNPRDSVAKEEDPNPSHQLYKLHIKSTWSTRQTLCLWNIEHRVCG